MDFRNLYLSAVGRCARRPFWIAAGILVAVAVGLGVIPLVGPLANLALLFPWACLVFKRLRDMGRSEWWAVPPLALALLSGLLSLTLGWTAESASGALALPLAGLVAGVAAGVLLLNLSFLVWVGFTPTKGA